ncbi:MAG: response regulator [Flavobacteriales bacterium]|nr:response regulator [Flavobacteriales bacterium]
MSEKHLVLVVDDEPEMRNVICAFLGEMGHDHISTSNYETAQSEAQAQSISCAILDLSLPDGNGMALIPVILQSNPCCSFIILTGDTRSETITEAIREGVSDYLMKPVDFPLFQVAINRALHTYKIVSERNRLHEELIQERELLKVRVEERNSQLREHAYRLELDNTRKEILLKLKSFATGSYTEEKLFGCLFEQLAMVLPLQCVVLTTKSAQDYCIVAIPDEHHESTVIVVESSTNSTPIEPSTGTSDISDNEICVAAEIHAGLDIAEWAAYSYPQHFMGQVMCAVGFFLPDDYAIDSECDAFLMECANTITTEWMNLRFLQYSVKQALVGNLALDQSRIMVQELTAIRTNVGMLMDTEISTIASKSLRIIDENAKRMGQRLLDFRGISSPHKNTTETVYLDDLVVQVLGLLENTIEERRIRIEKNFLTRGHCTLFNGSALASTFLDLISSAVRAADVNYPVLLQLYESECDTITFDISYTGFYTGTNGKARRVSVQTVPSALQNHPKFIMAQRTIQSCGGTLSTEQKLDNQCVLRTVLPKNVLESNQKIENIGVS